MANARHPGQRLRSYRERRDWSLSFLARLLGTTKGHLSEVERGIKQPGPPLQKRIEILTDIPAGWPVEVSEQVAQNLADMAQSAAAAGGRR